ncbi:DUF6287 domain-containing protein [Streptococcus ruminantium]|uniref:DUF6287 domain-containing protein n=1 Tax=Streptococcus ruminantium TaxID=1917441 RepID=UPI0012DD76E1|nr:DUF6287 domain-containing protein [Streptococcus ruminantium]
MKKKYPLALLGLFTLIVFPACHMGKEKTTRSSSNTEHQSTSSSISSTVPRELSLLSMDIDALMQGNYDSILGTWQNSKGETLVFNSKGLVDENRNLLGRGKITDGIFETGYVDSSVGEVDLLMIPKGTTLSSSFLASGVAAPTDASRDRIVAKNGLLGADADAFYRLSNSANSGMDPLKNTETGVQLESGPKTVDYANRILGKNNWRVTEGNYTRTESIPYNVLEGNDNTRYTVYQNGVIVNAGYQIIYQP